ncbi:MAG TPA: hydantoinase B/oxoprolinase family protein [bacterium]|nr:hydantoinase B/oxoprolinase family protein [bacterium]
MAKAFDPIALELFRHRFASLCEEMGALLGRSAFSPNIKERRDYSCAIFDASGAMAAQAAHIPVHLGSMPLSVKAALKAFRLRPGDVVLLNDPYRGGTHLPDITVVTPVFEQGRSRPLFYAANRAHHSDVGGKSPGSMPLATRLEEEGVVIPPTLLLEKGRWNRSFLRHFLGQVRRPEERRADLEAQISANRLGAERLAQMGELYGRARLQAMMRELRRYEAELTGRALSFLPRGKFCFEDWLDDDGIGQVPIRLAVEITVGPRGVKVDFSGSAPQAAGPVNATFAITLSAVAYVFRCLVRALTGEDLLSLDPIEVFAPKGSVLNARYPAPVAGGNVETSQRLVDVLFGALSAALPGTMPAASQGTMNNVAFGSESFAYYETLAGGIGAGPRRPGLSATHSHMTNTLNTPIEALENELPVRIGAYRIRRGSGGKGRRRGGDGLVRDYVFLEDVEVSVLSDRRHRQPYGLQNGKPGGTGANWVIAAKGKGPELKLKLPSKFERRFRAGETLRIETPGGGGFGKK